MKNPYENTDHVGPYFFVKAGVMPIASMHAGLFFMLSGHLIAAGVCSLIFLLFFSSSDEIKLLKYDSDFRESFAYTYISSGLYTLLVAWLDLFYAMGLLMIVDVFWAIHLYDVYERVYFEANKK
ncbi:hypothetical protein [Shewanella cyperi]|uniref:hypothetical protein n=1 Tax=Shewanella cyperi TaxID=2814292 RepID=UPI001A93F67B|nr:hypothetical protein [Shewanella cyperi]QSX41436.1 hypothetical protein JYB84_03085 [Shewanella cyperi]